MSPTISENVLPVTIGVPELERADVAPPVGEDAAGIARVPRDRATGDDRSALRPDAAVAAPPVIGAGARYCRLTVELLRVSVPVLYRGYPTNRRSFRVNVQAVTVAVPEL